jgi:hypothetical protein
MCNAVCLFVRLVGLFVRLFVCLFCYVCLLLSSRDSSKPVNTEDCTYNNVAARFVVCVPIYYLNLKVVSTC